MSVPIPRPNVPVVYRNANGDWLYTQPWYDYHRDAKASQDSGDMPAVVGTGAALSQEAIGIAAASLARSNGSRAVAGDFIPLPTLTKSADYVPLPSPKITQLGNGVWLIQDTVANIANYPTSLYNPGIYLATDTSGSGAYAIYRSDGTAWTLMAFISDAAYGAGWDGVTAIAPSKNAVYDEFVIVLASIAALSAASYDVLFDHFADAGNVAATGETDLYSDTLAAGQLSANGAKVLSEYSGLFVLSATATRQVRVYFGGSLVFDSGTLSITGANAFWDVCVSAIRESATVVRCSVTMSTSSAALVSYTQYQRVTGLTLSNTQVLKITGQAAGVGSADNDIVAKLGYVEYKPAA